MDSGFVNVEGRTVILTFKTEKCQLWNRLLLTMSHQHWILAHPLSGKVHVNCWVEFGYLDWLSFNYWVLPNCNEVWSSLNELRIPPGHQLCFFNKPRCLPRYQIHTQQMNQRYVKVLAIISEWMDPEIWGSNRENGACQQWNVWGQSGVHQWAIMQLIDQGTRQRKSPEQHCKEIT